MDDAKGVCDMVCGGFLFCGQNPDYAEVWRMVLMGCHDPRLYGVQGGESTYLTIRAR